MHDLLFWLYFSNAILLIVHEIDSAFWKEWELFRIPGGINVFLVLHLPLLFFILYGLVLVSGGASAGMIFSLALGFGGIFAFAIHTYFIRKGRPEFKTPVSLAILVATLIVSVFQLIATIKELTGGMS